MIKEKEFHRKNIDNHLKVAIDYIKNPKKYFPDNVPNNFLEQVLFDYVIQEAQVSTNHLIPIYIKDFLMMEGEERSLLIQVPVPQNGVIFPNLTIFNGLYLKLETVFDEKNQTANLYLQNKIKPWTEGVPDYSYFDTYYKDIIGYLAGYRPCIYIKDKYIGVIICSSFEFDYQLFCNRLWEMVEVGGDMKLKEDLVSQIWDFEQWIDGAKELEEQKTMKKQI